jgi:hypothetical protein
LVKGRERRKWSFCLGTLYSGQGQFGSRLRRRLQGAAGCHSARRLQPLEGDKLETVIRIKDWLDLDRDLRGMAQKQEF